WVRGYGLADSAKTSASPGQRLGLTATPAPDETVAAQVYPAAYWYSMIKIPPASELGHVPGGVNQYLGAIKNLSCIGCHQIGQLATRTVPAALGEFESGEQAWIRRIQSSQAGQNMVSSAVGQLGGVPLKYFGDWTDRIAAGELPATKPERPRGLERNIVATVRDWSSPQFYMHDLISTDRRQPTVNAYGKIYGAPELSTDEFPILDPVANTATVLHAPVRDADTPTTKSTPPLQPSPYWGDEAIWDSRANAHNPMFDHKGRVWYTAAVRAPDNQPAFCREGSDHPSAKLFPTQRASRHLAVYEPETGE